MDPAVGSATIGGSFKRMEHWFPNEGYYIGAEQSGVTVGVVHLSQEVPIRNFGVGLIAIATLAVAGFVFRRRRSAIVVAAGNEEIIDDLYAAGL